MTTKKGADNDFLNMLEKGIRDILEKSTTTNEEKIQAINAGTKLLQIRHKLSDMGEPTKGNFFPSKGK